MSGKHDNLSANTHANDMHGHFQTAKDMRKQILLIEIDGTQDEAPWYSKPLATAISLFKALDLSYPSAWSKRIPSLWIQLSRETHDPNFWWNCWSVTSSQFLWKSSALKWKNCWLWAGEELLEDSINSCWSVAKDSNSWSQSRCRTVAIWKNVCSWECRCSVGKEARAAVTVFYSNHQMKWF